MGDVGWEVDIGEERIRVWVDSEARNGGGTLRFEDK